jgi:hypothetical protein
MFISKVMRGSSTPLNSGKMPGNDSWVGIAVQGSKVQRLRVQRFRVQRFKGSEACPPPVDSVFSAAAGLKKRTV